VVAVPSYSISNLYGQYSSFLGPAGVWQNSDGITFYSEIYGHKVGQIDVNGDISGYAGSGSFPTSATDDIGDNNPVNLIQLNNHSQLLIFFL
jgi:hypothetical protein